MNFKNFFFAVFSLVVSLGHAQENFEGTVVQQRYVKLSFDSPVKIKEPLHLKIKRIELGRYMIPYSGSDEFIQSQDAGRAFTIFDGVLKPDRSGFIKFEDHDVNVRYSYIYWLESVSGKQIAGPLGLKIRDPDIWWSQEKIENDMDGLSEEYPGVVTKHTFGKTVENNPVNGLSIGNPDNVIALIGYTHAGESGAELLLYAAERILADHRELLNNAGLVIIPVVNIDSRDRLIKGIPGYQRKNSNGVDLNRNYPANWDVVDDSYGILTTDPFAGTYRGPSPASEPETKAVIEMIGRYRPKVFFDYHWMGTLTGGRLISYVGQTEVLSKQELYAELFQQGFYEDIKDPPSNKLGKRTWPGTTQRYCVEIHNIPAFTVEGNKKNPALKRAHADMATEEDLREYQQKHYRAILNLLQYLSLNHNE